MTSHDLSAWARIEPILDHALDLPPADRAAYLARACGSDRALRDQVERMLAAGEDPENPLEHSLASVAGPLLADLDTTHPAGIRLGEMLGPWRVVRALGEGGMGEVFLAERADGQFSQTAALKLVRRGRERDPVLIRRFLEERRILATLAHVNIARLLDGGVTAAGLPWFAMEYVAGRPLDRYCDDLGLDVNARLALMEQVLVAVAYAHRNLLVHRDLKPSNIFVTDDGAVKLLDFGVAKLLSDEPVADAELTLAGGRVMTPEYAAPEQVRGERVTTATDIYALGAVLYQLLTGQRAHRFDKRTAAEIERVVCETDPQAPSLVIRASSARNAAAGATGASRHELNDDLDTLILKALQKDPLRRYGSAEAMLEDLRRYRTGRPLLARPDSVRYRLGKFVGRHRVSVAAAVIVALALAGSAVVAARQARAARLEAARADRVKEFLIDLLHEADPSVTQGKEFSVRELLDRGTRRVDSALADEPAMQAELYEVLGNTYAHLGLASQADTLHRKGLAVVRRLDSPGDPALLDQVMAVAWGLNDRGHYGEADTLLGSAIAGYRAAGGEDSQALSDALDVLATTKKRLDQPAAAESLYRESLRLQIRLTGPSDTITASRLSDLGSLLAAQDRLAPAESAVAAAQAHRRGVLAPLDVKLLVGESNLAMIEMKRGDFRGAEPRLRATVAGLKKLESPGGLNLARALDRLALWEALQYRMTAAIATATRAQTMFRTTMGADHPETLNSLSELASYEGAAGDAALASAGTRSAYAGLRRVVGDRHDLTLLAAQRLAAVELEAGLHGEAAVLTGATLAEVRGKFGRITPAFAGLLGTEGAALAARADSTRSDSSFGRALAALEHGTRVDSAAFPRIVVGYSESLTARGQAAAAEALLRRALAFIPAGEDSSVLVVAELDGGLGRALTAQGKYREAEPLLVASLARYRHDHARPDVQLGAERDLAKVRRALERRAGT